MFVQDILIFCSYILGIILTLNGWEYSNHSIITMTDIGGSISTALACHTQNIEDCCAGVSRGRWRYPSGISVIGNINIVEPFRRGRGPNVTYLYRRDSLQMPLSGIYTCEIGIKNSSVIQQQIFVGLYNVDEGIIYL